MPRSLWKGPWCSAQLLQQVQQILTAGGARTQKTPLRIMSRASMITPQFLGMRVEIHNGKVFVPLTVREKMIGHRFGEFSLTRKRPPYTERSTGPAMPVKKPPPGGGGGKGKG